MKFRRERNLFVGKGIPPRFFEANVPRLFNSYRSNLSHFSNYKLIEPQEFGPFYYTSRQSIKLTEVGRTICKHSAALHFSFRV